MGHTASKYFGQPGDAVDLWNKEMSDKSTRPKRTVRDAGTHSSASEGAKSKGKQREDAGVERG
jgi:hypothetical protein